jgi:chemotaxis response regulator CheB
MNHFLDRATGEIHAHLNGSPELREALLYERTGRYLRIPKSTRDVDAARCRAFAPRMESAEARAKAVLALESGGPGAFRDVLLSFPNDEKAWFVFRDRRVREDLKAWLAAQGVPVDVSRPQA